LKDKLPYFLIFCKALLSCRRFSFLPVQLSNFCFVQEWFFGGGFVVVLRAGVEVLQAGVEGPCLHRPGNWLTMQLDDEPKPVYKVGFIREKGKATAREVQWSPEAGGLLLR
jgi:hypothetical protein